MSVREWGEIIVAATYALLGAVNTMPAPDQPWNLRKWFYDWSHLMLQSSPVQRIENKFNMTPNGTVSATKVETTGTQPPVEMKA